MKDSLKIAIAGATGYVGLELIRILSNHPKSKIVYLCARSSIGKHIQVYDKKINTKKLPKISKLSNIDWNKIDVIFTALPNGEAQKIAKLIPKFIKLIDLSADFRLENVETYKKWYGKFYGDKKLINESVYGLSEFSRNKIKKQRIIACPGCYPTSIQLPLIPLIQKGIINANNIVVDSKSGYSGAGKNINKKFKFKNLYESVSAYGISSHRHLAEIDQELSKKTKKNIKVFFTPHILPMFRGILSTIYIEPKKKYDAKKIYNFLKNFHKGNLFIKFAKFNKPIGTGEVIYTNNCQISVCYSRLKNKVVIISTIDNLIKGASGQAVQNMNIAFNFKESIGLK